MQAEHRPNGRNIAVIIIIMQRLTRHVSVIRMTNRSCDVQDTNTNLRVTGCLCFISNRLAGKNVSSVT